MEVRTDKELADENLFLREQLEEYRDLVESIRNGGVDALAITKNGQADIFSLESADFVYRVLVENFAEGALNITDKGLIIYANPAFEKLAGTSDNSIVGSEMISLVDPAYHDAFQQLFKESFSGNSKGEIVININNRMIPVHISLSSLYPRFQGIGILITNLSERKQQEEQISQYKSKLSSKEEELLQAEIGRKSIEKFRFMSNTIPQKVWTADSEGKMDYFNKKWLDYTQKPLDHLEGWGWKNIVHPEDWKETEKIWRNSIKTQQRFEAEHRLMNGDGEFRWHLSRAVAQMDENDHMMMWVGTTTDIHVQRNFTDELQNRVTEATTFLHTIFDSSEELITSFDKSYNFTSINMVAAAYTGSQPKDLIGKNILEVFPKLKSSDYYKKLGKVLEGSTFHEKEIVKLHGEERVFDTYYKPLIINNEVTGILIIARDITTIINITNSLQTAKQQLEDEFRKTEAKNDELLLANTELVSFTYVASHDLKEPLRKIMVFSNMILQKQQATLSEESKGYFGRIHAAAKHMQNLIEALLSYSKINNNQLETEETDLTVIYNEVKNNIQDLIDEKKAVIECGPLPVLNIIPFQFTQLFTNLLVNALKYGKAGESSIIRITSKQVAAKDIVTKHTLAADNYWQISFTDNGIGFEQVYSFKILELFQRLHEKEQYEGTGIGLAICNKIVQNHRGIMIANGDPGVGSVFDLYFPVA